MKWDIMLYTISGYMKVSEQCGITASSHIIITYQPHHVQSSRIILITDQLEDKFPYCISYI